MNTDERAEVRSGLLARAVFDAHVTSGDVARAVGVHINTVNEWAKLPGYPAHAYRYGGTRIFNWSQVAEWLRRNGKIRPVQPCSLHDWGYGECGCPE